MILLEDKEIGKVVYELNDEFKVIKSILPGNKEFEQIYNELFENFREAVGKSSWVTDENFLYKAELLFEFQYLKDRTKLLYNRLTKNS